MAEQKKEKGKFASKADRIAWQEQQKQRRIKKAESPDSRVIEARSSDIRSLLDVVEQGDRAISALRNRMGNTVDLQKAADAIVGLRTASLAYVDIVEKIHEIVNIPFRRPGAFKVAE